MKTEVKSYLWNKFERARIRCLRFPVSDIRSWGKATTVIATIALALAFVWSGNTIADASGNGSVARSAAAFDPFDWGLNLPDNPVARRISRHFRFEGTEPEILADIQGPGCIRRFWITGEGIGREVILRIYFDGEEVPYVEAPLGEFFGGMHNLTSRRPYPSHDYSIEEFPTDIAIRMNTPFISIKPKNGMSIYLPMPFAESARFEVVGNGEERHDLYYTIDFEEYPGQELEEPMRFAARWRREAPVRDYADEFIMVDADGPGRLIGFVYAVDMLQSRHGREEGMRWSHAGADNIYIDGDGEHPGHLRGIGGEDTFGTSYSGGDYFPQSSTFSDMPFYTQKDEDHGRQKLVAYRFFVNERTIFSRSLHMRFAARAHDVSSIVYWYSAKPVRPFHEMPPYSQRVVGSEVLRGEYDLEFPDTGQWWIAGPFDRDFEPILGGDVRVGGNFHGRPWQPFAAIRGFVDFNHVYRPAPSNVNSPTLEGVAVARSTLVSPVRTRAKLTVGWSDRMKIQVNGGAPIDLGDQPYFRGRTIEVDLEEGENTVAVWLHNGPQPPSLDRGAWTFSFNAATADGEQLVPMLDQ